MSLWARGVSKVSRASMLGLVVGLALAGGSPMVQAAGFGGGNTIGGSNNGNNNKRLEYKGGSGEAVKAWPAASLEEAKKTGKPTCLYIYDTRPAENTFAKFLETEVLVQAELKSALQDFECVKIKADGSDGKGWPPEWLHPAAGGAAILLVSSDGRVVQTFSRGKGEEACKANWVQAAAAAIVVYEKNKKEQAEKAKAKVAEDEQPQKAKAKEAEDKQAEKAKTKVAEDKAAEKSRKSAAAGDDKD